MLGCTLDDCLVEYICLMLKRLKAGRYSTEQFRLALDKVRQGMPDDPELKFHAIQLMRSRELPLASESYLNLAAECALYDGMSSPSIDEGSRFARVMLSPVLKVAYAESDMTMPIYSRLWADYSWRNLHPHHLLFFMQKAEQRAAAWDILMLICKDATERDKIDLLPPEIHQWFLGASFDRPKRPDARPSPANRPRKIGYRIRDNEIRHTVGIAGRRRNAAEVSHRGRGECIPPTRHHPAHSPPRLPGALLDS